MKDEKLTRCFYKAKVISKMADRVCYAVSRESSSFITSAQGYDFLLDTFAELSELSNTKLPAGEQFLSSKSTSAVDSFGNLFKIGDEVVYSNNSNKKVAGKIQEFKEDSETVYAHLEGGDIKNVDDIMILNDWNDIPEYEVSV